MDTGARPGTQAAPGAEARGGPGRHLLVAVAAMGCAAAVVAVLRARRRNLRGADPQGSRSRAGAAPGSNGHGPLERRAASDPEALRAIVEGTASRIGLDMDRLKELKEANYRPLVEYLGYIQVQRGGGNDTLLFVRMKDVDELAGISGQSREEFLKHFKKLGVVLSMN